VTEPILRERAQKYGRNLMFTNGTILALAWLPGINVGQFKILGFDFDAASGSELSFWWIMLTVFVYFAIRYYAEGDVDYNNSLDSRPVLRPHGGGLANFWILDVVLPFCVSIAAAITLLMQIRALM
jgi:hypothetical protein